MFQDMMSPRLRGVGLRRRELCRACHIGRHAERFEDFARTYRAASDRRLDVETNVIAATRRDRDQFLRLAVAWSLSSTYANIWS
jgi:hypothetical protein